MKKIIVVAGYAPSLINFRGPLLRALIEEGYHVLAIAPAADAEVIAQLRAWGVLFISVPMARTGLNPFHDWYYWRKLSYHFKREKPEVVFAYTHKAVIYSALAAKTIPAIRLYGLITGLGYAFADPSSRSFRQRGVRSVLLLLYRQVAPRWNGVFFQNPDDQELFRRLKLVTPETPQKIVRGSGIDLNQFPFRALLRPFPPRFLMISRLLRDKGVEEYIEAARIVRRHRPDVEFHLVGPLDSNPSAITRSELLAWERSGLIHYHGSVTDVRSFLANCSAYVLPSYREGTPRTVLEAMATGRAIVTTDVPGCRETVFALSGADSCGIRQGSNGMLVPVRDPAALAIALGRLMNSPELAVTMGTESRELAERYYAVEAVNQSMLAFMELCDTQNV